MANIRVDVLSEQEINDIHDASLAILGDTGVLVHHEEILKLLGRAGAKIDADRKIARLPERLVTESVAQAGKTYTLYGRDPQQVARFGQGDFILMSSPGQYAWIDRQTGARRPATTQDAHDAIRLGDALENISIVGAMAQPEEVSEKYRDVFLTGELVKGTSKPTRCWVRNGATARYILEIYRAVAGGDAALRAKPMVAAFLEPISPLQMPRDGLDIVREFAQAGQPVSIGPMAMVSATGPGTLAGTLAQENAEILAGVVVAQLLAPGTPICYGGIPHIMDPRTGICSFGSPEQGLMAVAMVQMGRSYGFPVYVNAGLTDAKTLDAQAGAEKGMTMLLGALAGADMFGHAGICGTDHAASLEWLAADNELMAYAGRIARGFDVTTETLAVDVVKGVGPAGSFLTEDHTVRHFRDEMWMPSAVWTRQSWDGWHNDGQTTMGGRLGDEVSRILTEQTPNPIDEKLATEIDGIVEAARHDLG
jgi:trimethylamine:corrinoid methyltransferase-like protein